jgi:hypothetical protein
MIETAGRTENFTFKSVYKPKEVANEIWRRLALHKQAKAQQARQRRSDLMGIWFEEYARMPQLEQGDDE